MISVPCSVNSNSLTELPSRAAIISSTRSNHDDVFFCTFMRLLFVPFEYQASIVTTEAHHIRHSYIDSCVACLIRNIIEVAIGIGVMEIDGWRDNAVEDG